MAELMDYPKLQFSDERLKNGLRLIMSENRLMPIVAVNLWYDVGSRNEVPGKTGLAHLFEHMMFEGSANVAKGEHFKLVTAAGGANNASTATFRTNYFEFAPSHHLEMLLWLEADRLGGLLQGLNQKTLDNQRDVVMNERRQVVENQPYGMWQEKTSELLFPEGHAYRHPIIGSMDDLTEASLKDVKDFFKTHYAPNNAVLTIAGDFDPAQARKWVEKYFGKIPANPKLPATPELSLPYRLESEARETLRDRVPYPGVFMSHRTPGLETRENDILTIAGAVLSVGKGSRMYQRLVRERITLDSQFFTISQPGVSVSVAVGIAAPGVFEEVVEKALVEVIDSLKTEPVTEGELKRAKVQVERSLISGLTTVAARADWLSQHAMLFDDPGKANERLDELSSVTSDEIKQVATKFLTKENRAVVTFLRKPPKIKKPKN